LDHEEKLWPAASFVVRVRSGELPERGWFRRLSACTPLGRYLCRELGLKAGEFDAFARSLLRVLTEQGSSGKSLYPRGTSGVPVGHGPDPLAAWRWLCPSSGSLIHRGAGGPEMPRAANPFFQRLYREAAGSFAALEVREHTAQMIASRERERRERRFRWLHEDQNDPDLGRRLPYLVCFPTPELGIDIADVDLVHVRNVPPRRPGTPNATAQRAARGNFAPAWRRSCGPTVPSSSARGGSTRGRWKRLPRPSIRPSNDGESCAGSPGRSGTKPERARIGPVVGVSSARPGPGRGGTLPAEPTRPTRAGPGGE
jgi:hypothetical protein